MKTPSPVLACPLCYTHFSYTCTTESPDQQAYGYGLDFRLIPRDCSLSAELATCPNCFFTSRIKDYHKRLPGHVKDLVKSEQYIRIFQDSAEEEFISRGWLALVSILDLKRVSPRDIAIMSLKGSWVAREQGNLDAELDLLSSADFYLDDALRRGLTKSDPGMSMYLLGEINRRRREFLRAREMLTFLGNNPRFRYPALLLTVLIEEEDSTPYWSLLSPDQMEKHSARFKGLFPALRSIPPKKTEFSLDELTKHSQGSEEDDGKPY